MCLDVEKYRHVFQPKDIFDLLPRTIIVQMVRGFFYHIREGVTLLWNEHDAKTGRYMVKDDRIDPFDYLNREDRRFFNRVCCEYRDKCGTERCWKEDMRIAHAYVDDKMKGFQRYPCWLGMVEQSFGLIIGGHVRAVLFTGQIVPNERKQIQEVRDRIRRNVPPAIASTLVKLLRSERTKQLRQSAKYADVVKDQLCDFAGMLQEILTRLFEARRDAATRELLQYSEAYLASVGFDNHDAWWEKCAQLTESFAKLVGLEQIDILTRTESVYEPRVPRTSGDSQVPARDVLSEAAGRLISANNDESAARLAKTLALPSDSTRFYVSHAHTGTIGLSTLIVLRGQMASEFESLTTSFCRIVSQRVDFFSLVAWQRQSQENYRISVARVAHDVRTPLQVIVWDLEEAEKFFRSDPTRRGFFARSIQRAMAAQEHLRRLTDSSAPPWKSLNLAWLLKEIMEDLHPMAHNHPCKLMPHGAWPDEIRVRGDSHQLNTAMTNLLDNAIKYSLTGRVVDGRYVPYEVRVSIDSCENNMVRVTISNFGVGIPPALLERIRSPGGRALVHGGYREQSGTGLGLPSAIGILENHGGWLNIHSNPADLGPRASEEEYHRYVTSIEAYLPRIR